MTRIDHRSTLILSTAALALTLVACGGGSALPDGGSTSYAGYSFAASNSASGNSIVRYGRSSDGKLVYLDTTATGANGIGDLVVAAPAVAPHAVDPLFSNDSLVINADHSLLFAVNAGSNSITVLRVGQSAAPVVVGSYPSLGEVPTGLAIHGSLLYVSHAKANAGGMQTFGFKIGSDGALTPIAGAAYASTAATIVTHTLFSPDGSHLVVVELMTGMIRVYPVNADGTLGTAKVNASAAPGPFGAEFLGNGTLFVSEVHPMVMNVGSVSSYTMATDGTLTPVTANVTNTQNATCWLAATPDGKYLYASNTSSSNVSTYSIGANGALTLVEGADVTLAANGATDFLGNPTSGPVDSFVSSDGKFFYQQFSGLGVVAAYSIGSNGRLTAIASGNGGNLPVTGSEGLVGY